MPILSIKNLKKIYHDIDGEVCAIGDINLDIYDKELVSIVGPSKDSGISRYETGEI